MGIDEAGVIRVRGMKPGQLDAFLALEPTAGVPDGHGRSASADDLAARATESAKAAPTTPTAWREAGDAAFLFGAGEDALDRAVDAYAKAAAGDPEDARARFRLGVARRRRAESSRRQPGDAQGALAAWGEALALVPNQYIWRRRIQQYGPRLDKPYDFYFWVEEARAAIRARGEEPHPLGSEPRGSEIAAPRRAGDEEAARIPDPDPKGAILRDEAGRVAVEPAVAPASVRPGERVRVRLTFRLDATSRPWWNNEADPLTASLALPEDVTIEEAALVHPGSAEPETREVRVLEAELAIGAGVGEGELEIPGYALYNVCDDAGGVCRFLRLDFTVTVRVDRAAPKLR